MFRLFCLIDMLGILVTDPTVVRGQILIQIVVYDIRLGRGLSQ